MAGRDAVYPANLGLFFDRPLLSIPRRGLRDGHNFRITEGRLNNLNLGWDAFGSFNTLNGAVTLIDQFFFRNGGVKLVFGTIKDLYQYDDGAGTVAFLTPIYNTATVDVSAASPAVVSTNTGTPNWTSNVKAGDAIYFGATAETDPDATLNGGWYTIDTVDTDDQLTLTTAVTGAPLTNVGYTARKLFTGDVFDRWTSATFFDAQPQDEDTLYLTNGVDDIFKWDGNAAQVVDAGLTFTCKHMTVYKNTMVYIHIIEDSGEIKPTSIKNSDAANPEELATGIAGEFIVGDAVDPLTTGVPLGDNLILYSARNIVAAQYVGDLLGYVFRNVAAGVGPISGASVADFGDYHEFVGPDSQYVFDGVSLREGASHVFREVLRTKSPNRLDLAFSLFDEENAELIWAVPLTSDALGAGENSPQTAYVEHYLEDTGQDGVTPVSRRDFPFTAGGYFQRSTTLTWDQISSTWAAQDYRWNDQFFEAAFPLVLAGDEDGNIWTLNTSSTKGDGSALPSYVRFGRVAVSDGRDRNLITRIYPFAQDYPAADYDLTVKLWGSDTASGDAALLATLDYPLTGGQANHFVSPFRVARYAEVEFGTTGAGDIWSLLGYDLDIRKGGRRG